MSAAIVYDGVVGDAGGEDQLFSGKKFFVAQRIPMRNSYLNLIRSNGGEVVALEKKADYLIADHCRRDCAPGTISYEFIEKSVKYGELQDPENHRAGPRLGTVRDAGAINRPTKSGKAAYTAEEDRILYMWVTGKPGNKAGGNEIYKQLEAKYPRHTWQSWRDRYLKHLRDRPPSAFNIPDNAPPSPPSDQPAEPLPPNRNSSHKSKTNSKKEELPAATKVTKTKKAETKEDISIEELAPLFDKEDWEELYAFVDVIDQISGDEYASAWTGWAESREKGNQSAEEWRQYYEKAVRPQWLRDTVSKRQQIRSRVEKRYQGEEQGGSQSQSKKFSEVISPKTSRDGQKNGLLQKGKQLKRERGDIEESPQKGEPSRLTKRRKSASPSPAPTTEKEKMGVGKQQQKTYPENVESDNPEEEPPSSPTPRASRYNNVSPSQDFPIKALPRPIALLQSPKNKKKLREQSPSRSSSPAEHPASEASTTHSLQEFRRSLNDNEEPESSNHEINLRPLSLTPSPAPSSPLSTSSDAEDPDPPLEADEVLDFFAEQHEEGFDDTFIARALKRTRCRPNLTIKVLDAWKDGKPLPNRRGIWSQEDDEDVESGDGVALARLERKHTFDGWGGITERLTFLDSYRVNS